MSEPKKPAGCGVFDIYTAMFSRRQGRRRCASTGSLPDPVPVKIAGSDDTSIMIRPVNPVVPVVRPSLVQNPRKPVRVQPGTLNPVSKPVPVPVPVPVPGNGIWGELESMMYDYQKVKGNNKLVRATSGNVMLYGNLGNIRANQSSNKDPITRYKAGDAVGKIQMDPGNALSARMDSEELKELGNKEFGSGRYEEALAFYDRAIALDPGKASYRSNKAAALTGLGRILEGVGECKEAIRIDPGYYRAHARLGSLYLR